MENDTESANSAAASALFPLGEQREQALHSLRR